MKRKTLAGLFFLFFLLIMIGGCATIFKGSTDSVNFDSDPTGAKVYVNGNNLGKTPFETELMSDKVYVVEFVKDGYERRTLVINHSISGGYFALDIILYCIPLLVDLATGDIYKLDQTYVKANLEQKEYIPQYYIPSTNQPVYQYPAQQSPPFEQPSSPPAQQYLPQQHATPPVQEHVPQQEEINRRRE